MKEKVEKKGLKLEYDEKVYTEKENNEKEKNEKVKHMKENESKKGITVIIVIIILLMIACAFLAFMQIYQKKPEIKSLSYKMDNNVNEEINKYIELEIEKPIINKELWAIASNTIDAPNINENWKLFENNKCDVDIKPEDRFIFIKDKRRVVSDPIRIDNYVSYVTKIDVKDSDKIIKLIKDEEYELNISLETIGNPDTILEITSEDENIVKAEDKKIIGVGDGITNIVVKDKYGNINKVKVQSTTLITLPVINSSKPFISYKQYTEEEAKILDDYLFYEVEKAGKGTRAGAVAAARFLTLQFKYRIPYFLENGRTAHFNHTLPYCDGEGRYYHEGLYLSESKYSIIEKSKAGPIMWGGRIMEYSTKAGMMPNGLDCSGFISWCLLNGGNDFGDLGAGPNQGWPVLVDKGKSQRITMELLNSHKVKAGDLIGQDGHVGIIVGVTDDYIYVADTYYRVRGAVTTEYTYKGLVYESTFTHIYDMDEAYAAEGNYTAMW